MQRYTNDERKWKSPIALKRGMPTFKDASNDVTRLASTPPLPVLAYGVVMFCTCKPAKVWIYKHKSPWGNSNPKP